MSNDVFISFSSKDKDITKEVYDYLSSGVDPLKCWYSDGNIEAGKEHNRIVPEEIKNSGVVVVLLSSDSVKSTFVHNEIVLAQKRNKTIIPVIIEKNCDVTDLTYLWGDAQNIDISEVNIDKLEYLKKSIQNILYFTPETPWYNNHIEEVRRIEALQNEIEKKEELARINEENEKKREESRKRKEAEQKVLKKRLDTLNRKRNQKKKKGETDEEKEAEKRLVKKILFLCILVAAIIGIFVIRHNYYTIPLNDYIDIQYEGFDGFGVATVTFLEGEFNDKYTKRIKEAKKEGIEASELFDLSLELSKTENLTNGEEIKLAIDSDRMEFKQKCGFTLKYNSVSKVTVEGLDEIKTFDPFEDLDVSFEGRDGYGILKLTNNLKFEIEGRFTADKTEGLSNGDKITVVFTDGFQNDPTQKYIEKYGMAPAQLEHIYTVDGLTMPDDFDGFSKIDIHFEGIDGYAKPVIELKEDVPSNLRFTATPKENLSNGDIVKVTITDAWGNDPTEYAKKEIGITIKELERNYTVEGLSHYVTSIDEISDEELNAIKTQAMDYHSTYKTNNWGPDETEVNTEYIGAYELDRKEGVTNGAVNSLIFVFVTDLTDYMKSKDTNINFRYYWFIKYDDVYKNANDEYSIDIANGGMTSECAYNEGKIDGASYRWFYRGYETLRDLKRDCVERRLEKYRYSTNINEDTFMEFDENPTMILVEEPVTGTEEVPSVESDEALNTAETN